MLMLVELHVRDLGVIADLFLVLGTGDDGADRRDRRRQDPRGRGHRAAAGGAGRPVLVRPGADEAGVEGRFVVAAEGDGDRQPMAGARGGERGGPGPGCAAQGRSPRLRRRRLATVAELAELGASLVDLLRAARSPVPAAARRCSEPRSTASATSTSRPLRRGHGGVAGSTRPWPTSAATPGAGPASRPAGVPGGRARAGRHRRRRRGRAAGGRGGPAGQASPTARRPRTRHGALRDDGGRPTPWPRPSPRWPAGAPLADVEARLRSVAAEVDDLADEVRQAGDAIDDDPERLDRVRERRRLLLELRRKYGERLSDVIAYRPTGQPAGGSSPTTRGCAELEEERSVAVDGGRRGGRRGGDARRAAAPAPRPPDSRGTCRSWRCRGPRSRSRSAAPTRRRRRRIPARRQSWRGALPLAKVASGGELARTMLAFAPRAD